MFLDKDEKKTREETGQKQKLRYKDQKCSEMYYK